MSFFEKLKEHNTKLLVSQINANGGNATESVDSIIDNLYYLAEKDESFGEETRFMRLDVRRTLASLCDTGRLVFKIEPSSVKWAEDDSAISLGGYLVEIADDGMERKISSFACGGAAREDVYSQDMLTIAQRQALMFSLASARAESNAYFNAGIGIEFKGGDVFDLEAMEKNIPTPEPVMPQPKSIDERKKTKKVKKENGDGEVDNTSSADMLPPETEAVTDKPDNQSLGDSTDTSDVPDVKSDAVTYEEALKVLIDTGTYAGQTIGTVLEKPQTARNIVWVYKHAPEGRDENTKKALEAAIEGYQGGALKNYLNR